MILRITTASTLIVCGTSITVFPPSKRQRRDYYLLLRLVVSRALSPCASSGATLLFLWRRCGRLAGKLLCFYADCKQQQQYHFIAGGYGDLKQNHSGIIWESLPHPSTSFFFFLPYEVCIHVFGFDVAKCYGISNALPQYTQALPPPPYSQWSFQQPHRPPHNRHPIPQANIHVHHLMGRMLPSFTSHFSYVGNMYLIYQPDQYDDVL